MLDLSFPWPIGPVPIALTAWASYGLYRAIVTRDGLTLVSAVSVLGLVAFLAAAIAHMVRPAIDQIWVIMLAQFIGTAVCLLAGNLLWLVKRKKPERPFRRRADGKLFRGMAICVGFLLVMDGAFYLFPNAGKCEHFTGYMVDKCAAQELFFGVHDPPLYIYCGVLLGVPTLVGLIFGVWTVVKTAGLPKADTSNAEDGAGR